jgi:predicted ATPase/DNA-binding SARP family transcriptional activator
MEHVFLEPENLRKVPYDVIGNFREGARTMVRTTPTVCDGTLTWYRDTDQQQLTVGTPAWYAWLERVGLFAFRSEVGSFTARKERKLHGSAYWKAYRKREGRLYRAYLGMSRNLTLQRLGSVAAKLADTQCDPDLFEMPEAESEVTSQGASSFLSSTLPVPLTALVHREQEQTRVCTLLRRSDIRFVTLIGAPGVGKTRLALAVANELKGHFADHVYFVELASVDDPEMLIAAIARTLGLCEDDGRSPLEYLQASLQNHCLLLLDNFEQLVTAALQLAGLLERCPHLSVLVTSRAALRIDGAYEVALSPLAVPDLAQLPEIGDLEQVGAVDLFLQRVQAILPGLELTSANACTISEICVRLDGLPLAIELAAAHIRLFPPKTLLTRLERRLTVLNRGPANLPARQQTLRNALRWSYDLLSAREQWLFRHLAIFADGCTLQAAVALFQAAGYEREDEDEAAEILEEVASLLDKSLVQQLTVEDEEPRLRLLETIREYGLEQLQECGELEATRQVHAAYYVRMAEDATSHLGGKERGKWLTVLEREYANLRATLSWVMKCEDRGAVDDIEIAVRLGLALWRFWMARGDLSEGHAVLEQVLAACERSGKNRTPLRVQALFAMGMLALYEDDYARVEELSREVLMLSQPAGDQQSVVPAFHGNGLVPSVRTSIPHLQFYAVCLGPFLLKRSGVPIVLCSNRNGQAILRYLVAQANYSATTDTLMALFWPEEPTEVALRRLQVTVSILRRSLQADHDLRDGYILYKQGVYQLNPAIDVHTDVEDFLALYRAGCKAGREAAIPSFEKACSLYTRPFLVEDLYADWSYTRREQLRQIHLDMCSALTSRYLEIRSFEKAAHWATTVIEENCCDEAAYRQMMRLYALQGRRNDAIREYQRCQQALLEALGVGPVSETVALYEAIIRGEVS